MTFELVEKGKWGRGIQPTEISIGKTSISFGLEVRDWLKKPKYIEIYLDRENSQVGFKATKDVITGFSVQDKQNARSIYIAAKTITKLVPRGRYEAHKDEGFVVIRVAEIINEHK